ncbi:MAG: DUF257 family protein [Thermococcus sp.]|uniref:DUF257 family protein n=1 Tax=Thermococcus sp. TaxID=35749 RepID=UPI001D77C150|nr:DUF257 family protein [Thermococcus sp.]MBO8174891.1 DUF257 family protein [Thermococcus sp.]
MTNNISPLLEEFPKIKPGEIVLIEHTPYSWHHLAFYVLATHLLKLGYPLIIDDLLDTLHLYKTYLNFAGLNTDFLNRSDVYVLKIGGHKEVGNVAATIRLTDEFYVHQENYRTAFDSILKQREFFVNIVLGFDRRIALIQNPYERYLFLLNRAYYLGNKKRVAFYFVNINLLKRFPLVLPFLEEISTTVVRIEKQDKKVALTFLKSPNVSLVGSQFEFSIYEILNYLKGGDLNDEYF